MLKHLGAMTFARGIYALSQAVLLVLLARDVGPADFGVIAAFVAIHTFLFLVAGMNTPTFVSRETALGAHGAAIASLRLNSYVLAASLLVALAITAFIASQPLVAVAVAGNAFAMWSERASENRLAIAYGRKKVGAAVVTLLVRSIAPLALYLALIGLSIDVLIAFAIARVAAGALGQLLSILLVKPLKALERVPLRTVFRAQLHVATSTTMGAIRTLDSVVVIAVTDASTAGIYSAISRIVSPFNTLAVAIAPVLVPRAATLPRHRARLLLDLLFLAGLVLSALTLLILPFDEAIVVFIFGSQFAGAGATLFWVLLRVGPVVASPLMSSLLQAVGGERVAAWVSVVVSISTLTAVAVGAAVWGASGAASGFAAVGLVGMAILWLAGRRRLSDDQSRANSTL